jgi:hypothetical protein
VSDVVEFTLDAVREYLDGCIWEARRWRDKPRNDGGVQDGHEYLMARCYVDAYQSVRTSIFGELLP